jgi:hypothetical protein
MALVGGAEVAGAVVCVHGVVVGAADMQVQGSANMSHVSLFLSFASLGEKSLTAFA